MFYELAKDKSLISVLRKANLDEETSLLVNEGANVSLIKDSLVNNLTSQNMIEYRRYIKIAKNEEEEEERRAEEQRADEQSSLEEGESDLTTEEEIYSDEAGRQARLEEEAYGSRIDRQSEEKDAYKELSLLDYQKDILLDIAEKANVQVIEKRIRNKTRKVTVVRGAMKEYLKLGSSAATGKLLSTLTLIKKDPDYLNNKYGKLLVDGILTGKKYNISRTQREEERTGKDIDVNRIDRMLKSILDLTYEVEGKEPIDFLKVFEILYTQKDPYGRKPRALVDRPRVKRERLLMMERAKKKNVDLGVNTQYERALRKVEAVQTNNRQIMTTRVFLENKIKQLEEILKDKDKIVSRKISKLNASLKRVISSGRVKDIQALTNTFNDINQNREKYVSEATQELEREIAQERRKLERLKTDLDAFDQDENVKELGKFLGMFRELEPSTPVKKKLTKGINLLSYLRRYSNQMAKITRESEGEITQGFTEFMMENPDVRVVDGVFEGFPTLNAAKMTEFEEASEKYQERSNALGGIIEELKSLASGEEE
tara:strand:+ start:326 stop:1954 length:1629 start_codon:yes stop_codon:yes gene_type:complete